MKLIDNRFRIEGVVNEGLSNESYIVSDLLDKENKKFLTLLMGKRDRKAIDYFIKEYLNLSKIKHKNMVETITFDIVETINLKRTNLSLYYIVEEYMYDPLLRDYKEKLSLNQRLKIILDIMNIIRYIHFRGFTYKHLSPSNIFISQDKEIKLRNLVDIGQNLINSNYDNLTESFIAPEVFIDAWNVCEKADYYSLGMMIKYFLYEDFNLECESISCFAEDLNLTFDEKIFLNGVISNLTEKNPNHRNIELSKHMDNIIKKFQLDISYNLVEERNQIYYNTNIVGREEELKKIDDIDKLMVQGIKRYNGAIVTGKIGSGRSKLLDEIQYKLRMSGRQIFYIKVEEDNPIDIINSLVKSMDGDPGAELLNKYRAGYITREERFRLYNRIANYFAQLSKEKVIYVVIDDINQGNEDFVSLINYLIFNLKNSKVFFILSTINSSLINNNCICKIIKEWKNNDSILNIEIKSLSEEQVGALVKSILAIPYIPKRFASFLYKESQGNLRYLDYIIKDLYNREELYMSKDGNWKTKTRDYSQIYIPLEDNHLIESQLKKIKGNHLVLLKAMSVFKNIILKPVLLEMVGLEVEEVDSILNEFKDNRIIEHKVKDLGNGYVFYNTELKRRVYRTLFHDEKIYFHKKIADMLWESYVKKHRIGLEELVYHLVQSDQRELAIELCLQEAVNQKNKYSPYTISLWELAYETFANYENKEILYVTDKLVEIYFLKGNIEETEYYLDNLHHIATQQNNIQYLIKADYYKAEIHLIRNELEAADKLIAELFVLAKLHNFYEGQVAGLVIKSKSALSNNNLEIVKDTLDKAIEISNNHKISEHLGTIYNLLGIYNHLKGHISIAIDYFTKSIEFSEARGNIVETIKPINNIGNIYSSVYGDTIKGLRYFEKGYEIANKYGFIQAGIVFSNNIADIYLNDLQYSKALYHCEKSREGAIEIGDVRGIVISSISLGSIYLQTNEYEKAYDIYLYLKNTIEKNTIQEIEVEVAYYNFLGEFYGYFGKWDEALYYSHRAKEKCRNYSATEYLRAEVQILESEYFKKEYYNKNDIIELLDKSEKIKTTNDLLKTIFRFSFISAAAEDMEFTRELLDRFNKIKKEPDLPITLDFRTLMELSLATTEEELIKIENYHLNSGCDSIYLDYVYHYRLGKKWFRLKKYKKTLKHLLRALDILYIKASSIKDESIMDSLMKTRQGDALRQYIYVAIKKAFNKEPKHNFIESDKKQFLTDYIDIDDILNVLSDEEIYEIVKPLEDEPKVKSLQDLLSKLNLDYEKNLDLILSFVKYKTLANKGYILWLDDNTKEYQILSSIGEDKIIPNENLLIHSDRNEMGILINKSLENEEEFKYIEFLPEGSIGIICLPITNNKNKQKKERRKGSLNIYSRGYIYLETNSYLNKFNHEILLLLNILSNLIYLNMENLRLQDLSSIDKLTGVLTRKYFDYQLDELLGGYDKYQGDFSLLMIDIDDFKDLNDNYGHLKGDEALTLIGKTLKENVRTTDLVARYGGEEFILILFNTTIKEGMKIGNKIRRSIEELNVPGINRKITVSVGLAQYPDHSQFKNELIGKADQALYNAKETKNKNAILSWTLDMGESISSGSKLAGIYTGNSVKDNANISAILDIVKSIKSSSHIKEKIYRFLGSILDVLGGEYASMFKIQDGMLGNPNTRMKNKVGWVKTPKINESVIHRVLKNKKAEFLIDWENMEDIDEITGTPIWQSIMVIPFVKSGEIKGIVYISVPLREKEFSFENLNLGELLSSIFIANLE